MKHVRLRLAALSLIFATIMAGASATPAGAEKAVDQIGAAASCSNYRSDSSVSFSYNNRRYTGAAFFGHYSGNSAIPSKTQVTSSGVEAQCILWFTGFNPGTIDGVFGRSSQDRKSVV